MALDYRNGLDFCHSYAYLSVSVAVMVHGITEHYVCITVAM